jgi:hypothetical protein
MFEGQQAYKRFSEDDRIRIAVRELAVHMALGHADMSRFCDPQLHDDAPDVIERWTGIDPRKTESGLTAMMDEAAQIRQHYADN